METFAERRPRRWKILEGESEGLTGIRHGSEAGRRTTSTMRGVGSGRGGGRAIHQFGYDIQQASTCKAYVVALSTPAPGSWCARCRMALGKSVRKENSAFLQTLFATGTAVRRSWCLSLAFAPLWSSR
eukprot:6838188-Prymnesium_polylepis.2